MTSTTFVFSFTLRLPFLSPYRQIQDPPYRCDLPYARPGDLGTFGLLEGTGKWSDKLNRMGKLFYDILGLDEMPKGDSLLIR